MAELYADRARWRNKPVRDISLILITLSIWCAVCGVKRLVEHMMQMRDIELCIPTNCLVLPAQGMLPEGKMYRVDPDFGSALTVSNRDSQSICWVSWKIMGRPCEFQTRGCRRPRARARCRGARRRRGARRAHRSAGSPPPLQGPPSPPLPRAEAGRAATRRLCTGVK